MKKRLCAAAAVLGAILVAPLGASVSATPEAQRGSSGGEIIEQVLVKVNGDIITKTELEQRQVAVLRQRMNGQVDPESLKNDETLKKMLADITPQLIVNAVDELLLLQRGRELAGRLETGPPGPRRPVRGASGDARPRLVDGPADDRRGDSGILES